MACASHFVSDKALALGACLTSIPRAMSKALTHAKRPTSWAVLKTYRSQSGGLKLLPLFG